MIDQSIWFERKITLSKTIQGSVDDRMKIPRA